MTFLSGWKTVIFNVVVLAIYALNQFNLFGTDNPAPTSDQVHAGLDAIDNGLVLLAAIGNAILRAGSNTTIFKSTSPAPNPPPKT